MRAILQLQQAGLKAEVLAAGIARRYGLSHPTRKTFRLPPPANPAPSPGELTEEILLSAGNLRALRPGTGDELPRLEEERHLE